MKHSLSLLASLPLIASCSMFDGFISRDITDSEFPGIQTQINCNPAPDLIYSKSGELIETIHPILHPSCGAQSSIGAVKGETAGSWWSKFGPATTRASFLPTESTDDNGGNVNPRNVASDDDLPAANTPTPQALTTSTAPPEGSDNPSLPDTPSGPAPSGPADPESPVDPISPTEPEETEEPKEPEAPSEAKSDCDGASHCEPDSKTDPEQYERWREAVGRNAAAAAAAASEDE